jgi:hypothetical protein
MALERWLVPAFHRASTVVKSTGQGSFAAWSDRLLGRSGAARDKMNWPGHQGFD